MQRLIIKWAKYLTFNLQVLYAKVREYDAIDCSRDKKAPRSKFYNVLLDSKEGINLKSE